MFRCHDLRRGLRHCGLHRCDHFHCPGFLLLLLRCCLLDSGHSHCPGGLLRGGFPGRCLRSGGLLLRCPRSLPRYGFLGRGGILHCHGVLPHRDVQARRGLRLHYPRCLCRCGFLVLGGTLLCHGAFPRCGFQGHSLRCGGLLLHCPRSLPRCGFLVHGGTRHCHGFLLRCGFLGYHLCRDDLLLHLFPHGPHHDPSGESLRRALRSRRSSWRTQTPACPLGWSTGTTNLALSTCPGPRRRDPCKHP
mmetsp:Transcript_61126/g.154335  ORF Transcript_61126/g.154335 Transcript_61126/m.154335 type:complete len:247 (-) Transcript_61126:1483-2223(-)